MKKIFWFVTGIAAGLAVAKQLAENPKAAAVLDDATAKAKEFGAAISEGFREREAELSKPVAKKAPVKKSVAKKPATARKAAPKKSPATKPSNK
jgi:TRAP-type mannitol/chloroaromatic compound transport system substrate-binding protein